MTPNQEKQVREEWLKTDLAKEVKPWELAIADFWLSKIDEAVEEAYQKGLHETAIKMDKEMIDWLKNNNEGVDFMKGLIDDAVKAERERIIEVIEKSKWKIPPFDFGPDGPPTGAAEEWQDMEEKVEEHNKSLSSLQSSLQDKDEISLCPSRGCMTHTVKGKCGKCRADKDKSHE